MGEEMEKWFIKNSKTLDIDYNKFNIDKILYKIILNRGIKSEEELDRYLNANLDDLYSPIMLKDMIKAANIVLKHINDNSIIEIVGDYDVDGVTSTYVLYTGLKRLGANVIYDIPNRITDGYGINNRIIDEAIKKNVTLIITCDNGIAAFDSVNYAKKNGIEVIITDHHEIPKVKKNDKLIEKTPDANAVIDPKIENSKYPFKDICGATVAFKLINYLYLIKGIDIEELYKNFLAYIAIATICDIMPLKDENRIIVKEGLKYLRKIEDVGLNALFEVCGVKKESLSSYHIGFIIGPTINAAGRLDSAKIVIELLLEKDYNKAIEISQKLRELNSLRQDYTEKTFKEAENILLKNNLLNKLKILVVYLENANESVLGIVAGRLKEKYNRPAIVLSDSRDLIKGSGRSIEEYDMFNEINNFKNYLESFGGHKMAAGLSLKKNNLKNFIVELNNNSKLSKEDFIKKIYIDMSLPFKFLNFDLIKNLEKLEPYGNENSVPLFGARELLVNDLKILGKNNNVIKMNLYDNNIRYEAILFEDSEKFINNIRKSYSKEEVLNLLNNEKSNIKIDIIYVPEINTFRGNSSVQIKIKSYRV